MQQKPFNQQILADVYQDIIGIKIEPVDSFISMMDKFYDVMRKHHICQGEWTATGSRVCNTAEWNMCFAVFKQHKILALDIWLSLSAPPTDLLAYGPKPNSED